MQGRKSSCQNERTDTKAEDSWLGGRPHTSLGHMSPRGLPGSRCQDRPGVLLERSTPHASGKDRATKGTGFSHHQTSQSCYRHVKKGKKVLIAFACLGGGTLRTTFHKQAFGKVTQVKASPNQGGGQPHMAS